MYLSCSDSNVKPIIYSHFTALEFMWSYSQQKLVEESDILQNTMKGFQGICIRELKFQYCFMISTNKKNLFEKCQAECVLKQCVLYIIIFSGLVKCELRVAPVLRVMSEKCELVYM